MGRGLSPLGISVPVVMRWAGVTAKCASARSGARSRESSRADVLGGARVFRRLRSVVSSSRRSRRCAGAVGRPFGCYMLLGAVRYWPGWSSDMRPASGCGLARSSAWCWASVALRRAASSAVTSAVTSSRYSRLTWRRWRSRTGRSDRPAAGGAARVRLASAASSRIQPCRRWTVAAAARASVMASWASEFHPAEMSVPASVDVIRRWDTNAFDITVEGRLSAGRN